MNQISTTKLSSKGQVVIPEDIRNRLHLHSGDQFLVIAEEDVIILKTIAHPSMDEYKVLINKARKAAREVGLTTDDINTAIKIARKID